ncbi:hypothetical protein QBC47DRAFT_418403 [Echria macrotheca]|uniref:Uncharacterized protein n=1 Tax=Echria macrotheca TaxID=438768 RepID=A0AAJ0F1K4_9PEZI|nr:hypothetical protein QBC47DRAFT_418403 [Echria macrotheca]
MDFPRITPPPRLPGSLTLDRRAWAQPENCVSGFSNTNTACSAFTSRLDACSSILGGDSLKPVQDNPQYAACFCRQDLFSDMVVCKGVHRQCILDYAYDPDFNGYQSQWLQFCSSASPDLHVTTPPVPTVTVPPASNTCDYIRTACDRYSRYTDLCASNYASNTVNCYCQPQIQYVESICTIDGGALCPTATSSISFDGGTEKTVELSNLWGYKSCKTWLGIPGTLISGASAYSRGTAATPTVTNVPFVDFPLTYFNVATDPVFNDSQPVPTNTNQGERLRTRNLAMGLCMLIAILIQ